MAAQVAGNLLRAAGRHGLPPEQPSLAPPNASQVTWEVSDAHHHYEVLWPDQAKQDRSGHSNDDECSRPITKR